MAPLTRSAATRYCWIAASTAALVLTVIVSVNLAVDPFGMYRLVTLEGVNGAASPAARDHSRYIQEPRGAATLP
jgi:hypothetical protein